MACGPGPVGQASLGQVQGARPVVVRAGGQDQARYLGQGELSGGTGGDDVTGVEGGDGWVGEVGIGGWPQDRAGALAN